MSDWLVRQRYGFGAGRVCLCPEVGPPLARPTFVGCARELVAEARSGGARALSGALGLLPALALVTALVIGFLATVSRERIDATDIEIVQLVEPTPSVEELLPEPVELPAPEPVRIAEAPRPPPPAPAPPPRVDPPRHVEPPEVAPRPAPPRVRIDALARAPEPPPPAPAPVRRSRPEPRGLAPPPPPVRIDPLDQPDAPTPLPESRRVFRVAARSPEAPPAPAMPGLDPLAPPAPDLALAPPPTRSILRRRPEPERRRSAPLALPSFDLGAPENPSTMARRTGPPRPTPRRAPAPSRQVARSPAPKALVPASLAAPSTSPQREVAPRSQRVERVLPEPAATPSRAARADDGLEAVPLSSLAACMTDHEEDALKLEVMAAVKSRKECLSGAGRYRFVETRNLNAFLMWIERAPGRKEADRCVELRLALACLSG